MKEKTLILFGGKSVEHDISIITALQTMKNLPKEFEFLSVYIDKSGIWWIAENLNEINVFTNFDKLAKKCKQVSVLLGEKVLLVQKKNKFVPLCKIKSVLNCCHGGGGENGSVAGLFELCNIPHTSSGVLSASLCMDKAIFKDVLMANKIQTPEFVCLRKADKMKKMKFPLVVKPCNLGSSIGVKLCKDETELNEAVQFAFKFDERVIVEKAVENLKELNCACFFYKNQYFVSQVNEVDSKGDIYSFEEKYLENDVKNKEAAKSLSKKIQILTEKVYKIFLCSGIVRVDFLYDEKNEILYVNEVNTIPGSLAFYLFKEIPFKELLLAAISQSEIDKNEEENLIKYFQSNALENFKKMPQISKK